MRLNLYFRLQKPELPLEYRRAFLSLLKQSFNRASPEVFSQLYETGNTMKPFTFSAYLPGASFPGDLIRLRGPDITLTFSTPQPGPAIYFYNHLNKARFSPFPLAGGNMMHFQRAQIVKEQPIRQHEAVFKTLSPFLVRVHDAATNEDRYLLPEHDDFKQQFNTICGVIVKELTGETGDVTIEPVMLKKVPVRHYGRLVEGNHGIIKLTGHPEILTLLFQSGIGSRRSEGFGALERLG